MIKNNRELSFIYIIIIAVIFFFYGGQNLSAAEDNIEEKINTLKWVAYAPTNFNPENDRYPPSHSIETDLKTLLAAGFNGLITYGSRDTLALVPKIAKNLGFKGVIMGIWDIADPQELNNAIGMAEYADGYCVGNEGLYLRYDLEELKTAIEYIKTRTNRPATTSEQITDYAKADIAGIGDWVFPNVHPFLCNVKSPPKAVNWIKQYYRIVSRNAALTQRPVLFKEIGYPTKGEPLCNQNNQKVFFALMEMTEVKFAYFEAFDQPWKRHLPVEPHWGLFDKYRRPKKFIADKIKAR